MVQIIFYIVGEAVLDREIKMKMYVCEQQNIMKARHCCFSTSRKTNELHVFIKWIMGNIKKLSISWKISPV